MEKKLKLFVFCVCCLAIASSRKVKMIGGTYANTGEFAYQVSLRKTSGGMDHFCGGSLLTTRHVLTAAHCVIRYVEGGDRAHMFNSLMAKVGSTSLLLGGKSHYFDKIWIHEKYDDVTLENDIAVVKLKTEVELSKLVQTVKLSSKKDFPNNASMLVSGFGSIYPGDPIKAKDPPSLNLRKLTLPAITREVCQPLWNNRHFNEAQFCTSTDNRVGTCVGDSGSPIMYDGEQFGIVSFGATVCAGKIPNICTIVGYYTSFIEECIKNM